VVVGIVSKTHAVLAAIKVSSPSNNTLNYNHWLTHSTAQRRRALIIPEEGHPY
jgi:hypothetical protein